MNKSILVIDDEESVRLLIKRFLEKDGHSVETAASGDKAMEMMSRNYYPVVLTDLRMPGMSGMEVLERIRASDRKSVVIIITAYGTIDTAVEATKYGAFDFLTKPINFDRLFVVVKNAFDKAMLQDQVAALKTQVQKELHLENIIGASLEMLHIFETIGRVSGSDVNILVCGESGTGKELIARAIHAYSDRSDGPFIPVNCVALAESLLESELFGHEKGSFTGAAARKIGYFEAANGGTVFLDEIGDLSNPLQAKLLRTVQEKTVQRVGSTEVVPIDVRIVSATNKNLEKMVVTGEFREDLYYRLNVITLELPPLRNRKDDLPLLVSAFIKKYSEKTGKRITGLSGAAQEILMSYDWPGNIRELQNVINRGVALADQPEIGIEHIPKNIIESARGDNRRQRVFSDAQFNVAKQCAVEQFEKDYISRAMERNSGNVTRTAEEIGLGRTALQRLLKKYDISSRDFKQ